VVVCAAISFKPVSRLFIKRLVAQKNVLRMGDSRAMKVV